MKNTRDKLPAEPSVPERVEATGIGKRYPQDELEGTVLVKGDIPGPVFPEEYWECLKP